MCKLSKVFLISSILNILEIHIGNHIYLEGAGAVADWNAASSAVPKESPA